MKQQFNFKMILVTTIILLFVSSTTRAQVTPAGKYNNTNFPEDRKAIEALGMAKDSTVHLNDDYIAVSTEGKVSYGYDEWKKGFTDNGATFKSVSPRPGSYILK